MTDKSDSENIFRALRTIGIGLIIIGVVMIAIGLTSLGGVSIVLGILIAGGAYVWKYFSDK